MAPPDRPLRPSAVAGLLALLLLVRVALVASLGDVLFYGEELEKGTAAKALLDGVDWPYHQIAYHPYEGGGFVVSHLLALAFALVGQSILAHKLVALGFGGLTLLAGLRLARRHFGRPAALSLGVLLALAPASFQKLSLLTLGIHFEACLFLILVLDATLALLEAPRDDPPRGEVAVLGLALGFGFYFNYQLAIAGLWATLWLALRRPRAFTGRSLATGLGALLLGLAPLLAMASRVGARVFDIHGTPLTAVQNNLELLLAFLRSLYVERSPAELVPALLYPAALAFALAVLARAGDTAPRRNALRLATFLLLWLAIYLTSGFVVGEVRHPFQLMRFAPVWVVVAILIAAGLGQAWTDAGARLRAGAGVLAALLLVSGAVATVAACREGSPATWRANLARLATTKGYDYAGYFAKVFPRLEDPARRLAALTDFDEPDPALLRADYGQAVSEHSALELQRVVRELTPDPPDADLVRGLGAFASRRAGRDIQAALGLASELPDELRAAWGEAVGRFGNAYAEFPGRIETQIAELEDGPRRADFLRGTGYRIWRRFVVGPFGTARFQLKPQAVERWIETLPAEARPLVLEGFREGERLHTLPAR